MTCIVGLVDKNKVYIGGDSAGTDDDYNQLIIKHPKVFVNSGMIFGYSGSFRMGQLLEHNFIPPPIIEEQTLIQYMCSSFIDAIRLCFKTGGFLQINGEQQELGGNFLVGLKGHLFVVEPTFLVLEQPYHAIGIGKDYALGSLATSSIKNPRQKIIKALEVSSQFNVAIKSPYTILSI